MREWLKDRLIDRPIDFISVVLIERLFCLSVDWLVNGSLLITRLADLRLHGGRVEGRFSRSAIGWMVVCSFGWSTGGLIGWPSD